MAKVGRPKKSNKDKVNYQLIAVHSADYEEFTRKVKSFNAEQTETRLKNVEAFHQMVKQYSPYSK